MSWFCCSGPKYHRRRFWCISARLRQLLKISPHPWRREAAAGLANLGFQPGPATKEGILGMHLLGFAWQPESQIHPGGLQSAEWNPTSFPRKIWTLSELPLPFWPQGGLHSAWAWWELRFISAALRVGAQHSWARGTPVPLRGPLSGPLAALLKQSAAAGGARALWAQERAGAHARWRWPPPGSAERCGRGQSSGGWPPGAFRQCPAWMGAAAPCCAARPRWVLAGASEWEALSAAVLACPPARHPRDSAPLPGREGAGARPALSALLVPRGSSGHRAGCRLSGRFWLLILNTVSESGGGGEVLPAAASRPCPYGTAAAPRERAGPGRVRLGGGNRAAVPPPAPSTRGSPGSPGPICLSPQNAGCPASAARMWWRNGAVSRGSSPWPGRTRWGACAACSTPSTSSSGWVRASGDCGARHGPGGAPSSGAAGTGEGKRPLGCLWCAPLARWGSSWDASKKSVWKLVVSEISVVLASCYKYTCECVQP